MNDNPQSPSESTPPQPRAWPWVILVVIIACLVITLPLAALLGMGWLSYSTVQNMQATTTAGTQVAQTAQAMLAAPPEDWTTAMAEEFVSNRGGWDTGIDEYDWGTVNRSITNGIYQWILETDDWAAWWTLADGDAQSDEFYLSVDARRVQGSEREVVYGLVFRAANVDNLLAFIVSDYGYMSIMLVQGGHWDKIIPWTRCRAIRSGRDNHLVVIGQGSHYILLVNDEWAGEFDNDALEKGTVGLWGELDTAGTAELAFDNFMLYTP